MACALDPLCTPERELFGLDPWSGSRSFPGASQRGARAFFHRACKAKRRVGDIRRVGKDILTTGTAGYASFDRRDTRNLPTGADLASEGQGLFVRSFDRRSDGSGL